jgi:hypothetical protein
VKQVPSKAIDSLTILDSNRPTIVSPLSSLPVSLVTLFANLAALLARTDTATTDVTFVDSSLQQQLQQQQ